MMFITDEQVATEISKEMIGLNNDIIKGFYRKTLTNMARFWIKNT